MNWQNIWEKMLCDFIFFKSSCRWIPAQDKETLFSVRSKHCDGRQSAISDCGNIMSADRVQYPIAEALWRPTECLIRLEKAFCRASEYSIQMRKHYDGRQSVISNRGSILSAVRVLTSGRDCLCRKWTWQMTLKMSGLQQKTNASILLIRKNYYLCPR